MQKAGALARHGVFVPAGQEEDPVLDRPEMDGEGHEGVIPVDDYERAVLRDR